MTDIIVQTSKWVTLVGAGQASKEIFDAVHAIAPFVVAADGGAQLALNYGTVPDILIGDFDSVNRRSLDQIPENRQFRLSEQDSTDLDKCLRSVECPMKFGVGFLGGRLDHQLAALSSLLQYAGAPTVLVGEMDIVFLLPQVLELELEPGSRFSLYPLRPVTGRSTGLEWPIDEINFAAGEKIGTSNRVISRKLTLEISRPGMLAIVPLAGLAAVAAGLVGTNAARAK